MRKNSYIKKTTRGVRQSSCTTQKPRVVTHVTSPAPAAPPRPPPTESGQPQSRHHSPTARSSQRHVPAASHSKSIAKDKGKGKRGRGGVQGKGQQTGIRYWKKQQKKRTKKNKNGSVNWCSEVKRCKQRMKFYVLCPKMKKKKKKIWAVISKVNRASIIAKIPKKNQHMHYYWINTESRLGC